MSGRRAFQLTWLFLGLAGSTPALASQVVVVEVLGGDPVQIVDPKRRVRYGFPGGQVLKGERVVVGRGAVKLRYPDGAIVFVGRMSDVTIGESGPSMGGLAIDYGAVRGIVPSPAVDERKVGRKPLRFLIRSHAAVLGVRGTDFVLETGTPEEGQLVNVTTLEGEVEVGRSEGDLGLGRGVSVGPSQTVKTEGYGLGKVEEIDREVFLRDFERRQPELGGMAAEAPSAAAGDRAEPTLRRRLDPGILQLEASFMRVTQESGGESFSPELSWVPFQRFGEIAGRPWGARLHAGLARHKGAVIVGSFFAWHAAALAWIAPFAAPVSVELGAGVEDWTAHSRMGLRAMGFIQWSPSLFGAFRGLVAGASYFFRPPQFAFSERDRALELRVGVRLGMN